MRIHLDSNGFDRIIAQPALLARTVECAHAGLLTIEVTHVQEEELAGATDPAKIAAFGTIPRTQVPAEGFVIGFSSIGEDRFARPGEIEGLQGNSLPRNVARDSLIANTARRRGTPLVTTDQRLIRAARRCGVEIWSPERYGEAIGELVGGSAS